MALVARAIRQLLSDTIVVERRSMTRRVSSALFRNFSSQEWRLARFGGMMSGIGEFSGSEVHRAAE
jgi:hypothetical protein